MTVDELAILPRLASLLGCHPRHVSIWSAPDMEAVPFKETLYLRHAGVTQSRTVLMRDAEEDPLCVISAYEDMARTVGVVS